MSSKTSDSKTDQAKTSSTDKEKKQVPATQDQDLPQFEKGISDKIVQKFGDKAEIAFVKPDRIRINVKKDNIEEVAEFIRDDLGFDHAESVSGVDYPVDKEIEVVYHLGSYTNPQLSKQILTLATRVPREDDPKPGNDSTHLPSLREIFYSVEFHERECFERLGVYFDGHPDNRRLLLPEDWADLPPLRKDFSIKGRYFHWQPGLPEKMSQILEKIVPDFLA